jgi:hypothetical protein
MEDGVHQGRRGGGALESVEHGHFPEIISRLHAGEHVGAVGRGGCGNLHNAFADDVEAVAFLTFDERRFPLRSSGVPAGVRWTNSNCAGARCRQKREFLEGDRSRNRLRSGARNKDRRGGGIA